MTNYHIVFYTENEKYDFIRAARAAGAVITAVSGYGTGYYIQFDADADQVQKLKEMGY